MPASDTTAPAPNPGSRHDDVVAIVNASGGSDEETIRARLVEAGIRVVDMDDSLEDQIATLVESGTKVIGVAGGDGSLRSAAVALADGDVALLPIAGGTKNHFAKAAGLATVDHSIAALERRDVIRVPLAALNEHCFLNTAVIGWYPDLVATRERLRKVLPRPIAGGLAALRHVPLNAPFDVELDRKHHHIWMMWVGNGQYGLAADSLAERESMTDGVVDVRLLVAKRRFPRLRVLAAFVTKKLDDSPDLERRLHREPVTIKVARSDRPLRAAIDAEPMTIDHDIELVPDSVRVAVIVGEMSGSEDPQPH